MSPILQILLTVALVTGGVATYHVLRDDGGAASPTDVASLDGRSLTDLERRIEALETRGPLLRGSTDAQDLWDQQRALADRVKALESVKPLAARTTAGTTSELLPVGGSGGVDGVDVVVAGGDGALSKAQEQAVRKLVDGAVRERMGGRNADRMNRTLERLGIELTDEQRTKLEAAWSAHRETMGETWRSARDGTASREEIQEQMATLNQEFTVKLAEFLPAGDAEAIGASMTSQNRGPGGGRGRGDRGGQR